MQTTRISSSRSRRSLILTSPAPKDPDDDFPESSSSSSSCSRPSSKRSSCSQLSNDSGAGSFDDPQTTPPDRRFSSPDFWIERRHTAPIRKLLPFEEGDGLLNVRPNTVWGGCSPRCSLSKYAPLPAIGTQGGGSDDGPRVRRRVFGNSSDESPVPPQRRRCFMGPIDIDEDSEHRCDGEDGDSDSELTVVSKRVESALSSLNIDDDDVTNSFQESYAYKRPVPVRRQCFMETSSDGEDAGNEPISYPEPKRAPLFSLTLDSETDSDFEEEPDSTDLNQQEDDEDEDEEESNDNSAEDRPRKGATLIRSATFTIEKERPDIRGPFLTVAIRLPNSTRIEEKFECRETLGSVCETALDKGGVDRPHKYVVITNEVPRRTFSDMTMSLKEAGIDDKTLLYLESLDDSESE